ncbi:hypothetical protein CK203_054203 [Vitis vinifera]|uniref:Uncharacterized protein n=1 Tax=Vitis vinifera TaxID=29760 RepID=A0A438HGC1_VITVI|nr:hypothetical protein CK203_054203 [Vitis vinifera]
MSTSSKSQSSAIGSEDYFNWHENIERRQRESDKQMQALLHETRRLREKNEVLRIQETTYPRNAEFLHNEQGMQPEQRSPPTCHVQPDENSNSTSVSAKRRHDKKSQLSNVMCSRLVPQMPSMGGKPYIATAQEACPGPSTAPIITNWPPHLPVQ